MDGRILVTGATGVLGRAIVKAALDAGLPVRQGVRNPATANAAAEAVHFRFAGSAAIARALQGASAVVHLGPLRPPSRYT